MKILLLWLLVLLMVWSCASVQKEMAIAPEEDILFHKKGRDTVHLGDKNSDYDLIVIEPGFNFWLQSMARQRGYYTQNYLENRNHALVILWNQRVLMPDRYDPQLYEFQIDYDPRIDYGYELNYKLYNYFIFFQRKYKQRLGSMVPRI